MMRVSYRRYKFNCDFYVRRSGGRELNQKTKNTIIKGTLQKTRARRKTQACKTYELKVDASHLSNATHKQLERLFLEAKWFYNYLISNSEVFNSGYKMVNVQVKVKDHCETRSVANLSAQVRQEILDRIKDNRHGLDELKKNGHRVGTLKFKSEINSIPLKQYGKTWQIVNKRYVKIERIQHPMRVRGLHQIPEGAELASAILVRKHGAIYLHVSTYQQKPVLNTDNRHQPRVGIDFGIKNQMTLSNSLRVNYEVAVTRRILGFCKQLSRRKKHSGNWNKTRIKLEKEYDRLINIKHDVTNKLVHELITRYGIICIQNDNLQAWHRIWGKRMLNTALGGINSALQKKAQTLSQVDRFYPSTKLCCNCCAVNEIPLGGWTYFCQTCGLTIDRDLNASVNILREGLRLLGTPMESRSTPADTETVQLLECLNHIPRVRASLVEETGSPRLLIVRQLTDYSAE